MWRVTWKFLVAGAVAAALAGGWLSVRSRQDGTPVTAPVTQQTAEPAPAAEHRVTIDNFAFNPQVLTVAPGTRVTWLNRDDVPHTATSSDWPPRFRSDAMDTDAQFSYVFTAPGTYHYFCAVHPKMTGTIVVK